MTKDSWQLVARKGAEQPEQQPEFVSVNLNSRDCWAGSLSFSLFLSLLFFSLSLSLSFSLFLSLSYLSMIGWRRGGCGNSPTGTRRAEGCSFTSFN